MENQDFTGHIHLLGYSEATISRILDTLAVKNYPDEVAIVRNMDLPESIPFCPPGIRYKKIFWKEWAFDEVTHRCLPALVNPHAKKKVVDFFQQNNGVERKHYVTLSHPASVIASTVILGNGCFIEPGSVIASFARLGFGIYVNRGCTIGHHAVIEDFVNMGPASHIAGHCHISAGVQLGMGAVVFDHVAIGPNTIIGGGSVVTKDIPGDVVAWGNPCKIIKTIPDK